MLLEPGPIALIPPEQIPQAGAPPTFGAYGDWEAATLQWGSDTLAGPHGALAGAGDNTLEYERSTLAEAAAQHGSFAGSFDDTIASVAGAAASGDDELGGLSAELAADLNVSVPGAPEIPEDGYTRQDPDALGATEWDAIVMQQVRLLTGTSPTADQWRYARRFEPDLDALRAWIRAGMPLEEAPPPPPPEAPPPEGPSQDEWYAGVDAIFVDVAGRHAFDGELYYTWLVFYPDLGQIEPWIRAGTPS